METLILPGMYVQHISYATCGFVGLELHCLVPPSLRVPLGTLNVSAMSDAEASQLIQYALWYWPAASMQRALRPGLHFGANRCPPPHHVTPLCRIPPGQRSREVLFGLKKSLSGPPGRRAPFLGQKPIVRVYWLLDIGGLSGCCYKCIHLCCSRIVH